MHQRIHAPEALDQRHAEWRGGRFDAGRRPRTPYVKGETRIGQHLVLVTLKGGARRLSVSTDCGHRHVGRDLAGAVSFLPAGSVRRIELEDVKAEWATVALDDEMLRPEGEPVSLAPFTNAADPFAFALVAQLDRLHVRDGGLEPAYAEAMAAALARHLLVGRRTAPTRLDAGELPRWKLARVEAFVEANLARPIAIAELALEAGLSTGRFHRAFKAATGQTPLRYLQAARVRRAQELLSREQIGVVDVAAAVGFANPSHFARVFRSIAGAAPSRSR